MAEPHSDEVFEYEEVSCYRKQAVERREGGAYSI